MFQNFDYLSPSVTLFYLGNRSHISAFGGFLTIIMFILILIFNIIFIFQSTGFLKFNSTFYKQYEPKSIRYYFDDIELFHFLYLKPNNKISTELNNPNKYIRIIAYNDSLNSINNDHWIYDLCKNDSDNKLLNKTMFMDINFFSECLCLKYFYDSKTEKYYNKDENEFKYPYIQNINNGEKINLNINVEKCINNTIFNNQFNYFCVSENDINNYLSEHNEIYLYYHNHRILIENNSFPYYSTLSHQKYTLQNYNNLISVNYIYISSLYIFTYSFGIKEKKSFIEDSTDEKYIFINNEVNQNLLLKTIFKFCDYSHIYTRKYFSILFDIFPKIGGIIQIIYYLFYILNYLYYKYVLTSHAINQMMKIERQKELINLKRNSLIHNYELKSHKNTKIKDEESNHRTSSLYDSSKQIDSQFEDRKKISLPTKKTSKTQIFRNLKPPEARAKKKSIITDVNSLDNDNSNINFIKLNFNQNYYTNNYSNNLNYLNLNKNKSPNLYRGSYCYSIKERKNEDEADENKKNIRRKKTKLSKFFNNKKRTFNHEGRSNQTKNFSLDRYYNNKYGTKYLSEKEIKGNRRISKEYKLKNYSKVTVFNRTNEPSSILTFNIRNANIGAIDENALEKFKGKFSFCKFIKSFYTINMANYMNDFINMRNKIVSEEQLFSLYINNFNLARYFREKEKI